MEKNLNTMVEVAEILDWNVQINGDEFTFERFSPAGQDFDMIITAKSLEEAIEKIQGSCDNFDCSEEAYLWLDNTGHGKNGAPYDMKDLYEDMEACLKMMEELRDTLEEINR